MENVVLLPGELSGHADAKNVRILAVHLDDGFNEVIRDAAAVPPVHMERGVAASVLVVAVIKKARQLRRVSTHEQPRSGRRKCAQHRLKNLIVHAAGLVDDVEDVVSVKSL